MTRPFYCSYCDDLRERTPCERCGHPTRSMQPIDDAYLRAEPQAQGGE